MHLIIPYAASHALNGPEVWGGLQLPHLQTLLGHLQRQQVWQDPETTPLHLPHERLHAQALGWSPDAPTLPWAAWHQAGQGQPSAKPQAWMTPCYWQVGMDQVVMLDPDSLFLSDEESQQLLQAMQPFLQEDGLQVTWHSALLWHAQGDLLADLNCARVNISSSPCFPGERTVNCPRPKPRKNRHHQPKQTRYLLRRLKSQPSRPSDGWAHQSSSDCAPSKRWA